MKKDGKSTYYFIGNISDRGSRYQVQDVRLLNGTEFSIFLDGLGVKYQSDDDFDEVRRIVRSTMDLIVAATAFQMKRPITYTFQSWVEAKSAEDTKDIIGWFLAPGALIPKVSTQRSRTNTPWKKAGVFFNKYHLTGKNENHALALKDFHMALKDNSVDSFLYAYRALEDICRAVSGMDDVNEDSWKKTGKILGITESIVLPLKTPAIKVRHGAVNDPSVIEALKDKNTLLDIAHNVISKEMNRTFPSYL